MNRIFAQGTGHLSTEKQCYILQSAIDLGINLIDTSEGYCAGNSEILVGKCVKGNKKNVAISTKVMPEHLKYSSILKACEDSLRRLNIDFIDIYSVHWPNPTISLIEVADAFNKLLEEKKILSVGACNFSLDQLIIFHKYVNLQFVQNEFNMVDRSIEEDILPYCQQNDIKLLAYSPLDQGKLENFKNLEHIAVKYNKTIPQIVLRWLSTKKNLIPLPESYNIQHIQENINAHSIELTLKDINEITSYCSQYTFIKPNLIKVVSDGRDSRDVYTTIDEAIDNKLNLTPGPLELSKVIQSNKNVKPIKVRRTNSEPFQYELVSGRVRYWAWVIAYGVLQPIKTIIVEN